MIRLMGTTSSFIATAAKKQNPMHVFFKPYMDGKDFFYRAAAIITAPIVQAGLSVCSFVLALFNLFKALYEVIKGACTGNWKSGLGAAQKSAAKAGNLMASSFINAVAAFVSPAVETADVIGSAIKTAANNKKIKTVAKVNQKESDESAFTESVRMFA